MEERPRDGRGRPSAHQPRAVKALRERLQTSLRAHTERRARLEAEAGCCGRRTKVRTTGDLAQNAGDSLKVDKDQQGTEQNYGFLKDPVLVQSLLLKKPERIEALGLL